KNSPRTLSHQDCLKEILQGYPDSNIRQSMNDDAFFKGLHSYLQGVVATRIQHVSRWIRANTERFERRVEVTTLLRMFEAYSKDLHANITLCGSQCSSSVWSIPSINATILLDVLSDVSFAGLPAKQTHSCYSSCELGICEILTAPSSMKSTYVSKRERYDYTMSIQLSNPLPCAIPIKPNELQHSGPHSHSEDPQAFHYCEARCKYCEYFCTLPLGHSQQEHETSHGSMLRAEWIVDGDDNAFYELEGHKYVTGDSDTCRATDPNQCNGSDIEHIQGPIRSQYMDWITHKEFWRRSALRPRLPMQGSGLPDRHPSELGPLEALVTFVQVILSNDTISSPDDLVEHVLKNRPPYGGTDYTKALKTIQDHMEQSWSPTRFPVIVFLSDGECNVSDSVIDQLCRTAMELG
ncbi:15134_t:CDS:10, partial [Acaulospora colombiana]